MLCGGRENRLEQIVCARVHRLSAADYLIRAELGEQLVLCGLIKQQTAFCVPCDGVVTAGTGVSAAGHP